MEHPAPKKLSHAARQWWREIMREFVLDDTASRLILETTLRAFDRAEAARRQIDTDGLSHVDTDGRPAKHPLLQVEHACRAQVLAGFRLLALDPALSRCLTDSTQAARAHKNKRTLNDL